MKSSKQICLVLILALCIRTVFSATYEVGAGDAIADVPWDNLQPGDLILIHYRAQPYQEKWVICCDGTEAQPIIIRGIPDASGNLPVIEGTDAITPSALNYWNEARGVIKIGGANKPSGSGSSWVVIENLDIKSGRQPYSFTGRNGLTAYSKNSAAIYLESGQNITIRNCILRDCGNGLFAASASRNILVEGCYIYDNGVVGSIYEHNNYTEAGGITFQYNYFGPLRSGAGGNNLKDRSAGCIIRYNWIEGGNRQLDLVDSDYSDLINRPDYRQTMVYGNILYEPNNDGNSQICHYGGDSGDLSRYRKGTLYFYNNTVISARTGNTTLLRLSSNDETTDCRNNIIYVTDSGSSLAMLDDTGTANLHGNWLKTNWRVSHSNPSADVNLMTGNLTGTTPGFSDFSNQVFNLQTNSSCINVAFAWAAAAVPDYTVDQQYVEHRNIKDRPVDGSLDIGAFEASVDADSDGIADDWEWSYMQNLTSMTSLSNQDSDHGLDWEEYIAGTNPTNANSFFALAIQSLANPDFILQWPSADNRLYTLQTTTNLLTPFSTLITNVSSTPPTNSYTNTTPSAGPLFYRVDVELQP